MKFTCWYPGAFLSLMLVAPATLCAQSAPVATTPAPAAAATPVTSISNSLGVAVFPAKGQTAAVQSADEGECYTWARGNTGIDPTAAPAPTEAASAGTGGTRVKSAATGAVAGTAIGAVAGDAGQGAAIGATAGALKGGSQARKSKANAKQQAAAQAQADKEKQIATFNKSFAACLEGKGYTTK